MKDPNYFIDTPETAEVKRYALDVLRADLVGIASIGRFVNAPLRMSPQGIMPSARSVIVMAVHHPDAAMERGGLEHPQIIGPYAIQYSMNWRLDDMSYRMGRFLEEMGFRAVPIASSNIWRYRGYKDLTAQFAPDVSHMHCAVAAGLAEFGFNGLALTPEFGAHQRYVTIITDGEENRRGTDTVAASGTGQCLRQLHDLPQGVPFRCLEQRNQRLERSQN